MAVFQAYPRDQAVDRRPRCHSLCPACAVEAGSLLVVGPLELWSEIERRHHAANALCLDGAACTEEDLGQHETCCDHIPPFGNTDGEILSLGGGMPVEVVDPD